MARAARVIVCAGSVPPRKAVSSINRRPTLLWIDDFEPALALYKATMEALGFNVLTASSGAAGVKLFLMHTVDLVITDYEMPELKGDAVARMLKAINPKIRIIMFSGSDLLSPASRRWIDAFCDKAGPRKALLSTIYDLLPYKAPRTLQPAPFLGASDHERQPTVA